MNSSQNSQYIQKSRKFHDAWAFILYAITYIGFTSFSIINIKESKAGLSFTQQIFSNGIMCSAIVLGFIAVNFIGLRFFPEFFLKTTICCFPVIILYTAFAFMSIYGFIGAALSLVFWGLFVYNYWSMLKLVGKILRTSVSILMSNFFTLLIGIIGCSVLQCFQLYLILAVDNERLFEMDDKNVGAQVFTFFYVLNIFWTLTNAIYFFKVYITSIIAINVVQQGDSSGSKFGDIMKNSLYALGSVCFAGLIVAIVTTLRFFVDQERERRMSRDSDEESNILVDIMLCLASFFLSILERFIQFANALTLPYIAIHGSGYTESIEKAFEISTRQSPVAIIGLAALDYSLFISTILVSVLCGSSVLFHFVGDTPDFILVKTIVVTTLIPLIFYFTTMMTIASSYLGLVYMEAEDSGLVQSKYIDDVRGSLSQYK